MNATRVGLNVLNCGWHRKNTKFGTSLLIFLLYLKNSEELCPVVNEFLCSYMMLNEILCVFQELSAVCQSEAGSSVCRSFLLFFGQIFIESEFKHNKLEYTTACMCSFSVSADGSILSVRRARIEHAGYYWCTYEAQSGTFQGRVHERAIVRCKYIFRPFHILSYPDIAILIYNRYSIANR